MHALKNLFLLNHYSVYHPCLSTGSREKLIKKERKKSHLFFFPPQKRLSEGGGQSLEVVFLTPSLNTCVDIRHRYRLPSL